jgi:hypothetical protein
MAAAQYLQAPLPAHQLPRQQQPHVEQKPGKVVSNTPDIAPLAGNEDMVRPAFLATQYFSLLPD